MFTKEGIYKVVGKIWKTKPTKEYPEAYISAKPEEKGEESM